MVWGSTCVVVTGNWLRSSGNLSAFDVIGSKLKRAKLQATILLPLETKKVARGNNVILSPNFVTKAPLRRTQLIIVVV